MSKKIIIFAIVGIVIAGAVWYMGRSDSTTTETTSSTGLSSSGAGVIGGPVAPVDPLANGSDFAQLLSTIDSISLDTGIFRDPSYLALRDNKVILIPEPIGRPNPFAPIGSDEGSSETTPLVETFPPGKVTATTAEFSASVTLRDNVPVKVLFEYGTSDIYGNRTSPITLTKSDAPVVQVKDLMPGTTYLVRVVAEYGSTPIQGSSVLFTTSAAPLAR